VTYTTPPMGGPRPLTAREINQLDLVEIIMRAPLDQAVTIAVGRASTCWTPMPDGVFDEQTANQIVNALLARINAELAVGYAEARDEDQARALIPTLAFPTEVRTRRQCPERLRLEGHPEPAQCLLLEGAHDEHQNGNLRWSRNEEGEITAWFDTAVYEAVGLGDLLRSGVHLTLPHLPADTVEDRVNDHLTPQLPPPVSKSADTQE
jgi:hypothetical protein